MKINDKLSIEVEREPTMRADEYVVITFDKEGNEVQGFKFRVDDKGRIQFFQQPHFLTEGVTIV